MAINLTAEQRRQQGIDETAQKIALEVRFERELKELFREIANQIETSIALNNEPDLIQFEDDISGLLVRQYTKVSNAFEGQVLEYLVDNKEDAADPIIAAITAIAAAKGISYAQEINSIRAEASRQARAFNAEQSKKSAALITDTNIKQTDQFTVNSRQRLTEEFERQPTNQELAKEAGSQFRNSISGRVDNIAISETQNAAEGRKDIERNATNAELSGLTAILASVALVDAFKKRWNSLLDGIEREAHNQAHGQLAVNGVFTVAGESLRYPRDSGLGASAGNTLRCRCFTTTST